ncbi:MAG: CoB--CoM heterodisulfide reductase iron-sulfur subunit A family protein [Deltaproteobacteria bacterium]|nr:CoB--CoM heterodisulfide reductase iron-sulfur subunit A family protein [Deltaproteobacteria bacterium]
MNIKKGEFVVVGGGISGIAAAVEIAEFGNKVTLIEKEASLGGRVSKMSLYFPKLCPPYCGLEIYFKRIRSNPNIQIMTLSEVANISGTPGNFTVTVRQSPRYVNAKCTGCNDCVSACPVERPSDFDYSLSKTKAVYLPHELSFPYRYVIDDKTCPGAECGKCILACKYDAIDLGMKAESVELKADAVIVATGWKPYDAQKLTNLNYGKMSNLITNVMMERLAAPNGPTKGEILRPSDNKKVERVAFVQCAGSRDENHLPYCSAVCCTASLKQVSYVKEFNKEAQVSVFYIDLRVMGRNEDFLTKIKQHDGLKFVKGKVARITEDPDTKDVWVEAEDILSGAKHRERFDMAVLATGIEPSLSGEKTCLGEQDKYGFFGSGKDGIFHIGCCHTPSDVSACVKLANGAVLKAMQCVGGRA